MGTGHPGCHVEWRISAARSVGIGAVMLWNVGCAVCPGVGSSGVGSIPLGAATVAWAAGDRAGALQAPASIARATTIRIGRLTLAPSGAPSAPVDVGLRQ